MVSNFNKVRLKDQVPLNKLVLGERYLELEKRTIVRSILDLRKYECPGGALNSDLTKVEREILKNVLAASRKETDEKVKKNFLIAARMFARKTTLYRADFYTESGELTPKFVAELPAFSEYLLAEVRIGVNGHYPNIGRVLTKYSFDEVRNAYLFLLDHKSSVVRDFAPTIINRALSRINLEDTKAIAADCENKLKILLNDKLEFVKQNARSILYGAIRRNDLNLAVEMALETPDMLARLWHHSNDQVRSKWRDLLNKAYLSGNLATLDKLEEKCVETSKTAGKTKNPAIIRKIPSLFIRMSLGRDKSESGDTLVQEIKKAHKELKASPHKIVRKKSDELISVSILRRNLQIAYELAEDLPAANMYLSRNSKGKYKRFNNRILSAAIQENDLSLVTSLVGQVKEEYEKLLKNKSSYVTGNAPSIIGRLIRDNKVRDAPTVAKSIVDAEKLIKSKKSPVADQYEGTLISSFVSSKWSLEKLDKIVTALPTIYAWLSDSRRPKIVRETKKKIALAAIKSKDLENAKKLAKWAIKKEEELQQHNSQLIRSNSTKIIKSAILSCNLNRAEKLANEMVNKLL